MNLEQSVEAYKVIRPNYVLLTNKVQALLTELLKLNHIKFHLIDGRAKTVESFQEKIRRPNKSYSDPLQELSDLSGVRVIVYYHDDVEKVAEVLATEFEVVEKEISHQASEYNPEEFGYISLHYIVKVRPERAELAEWKPYKDLLVEIQIRTVLQHSWASISHALQYKNESDVPKPLRRKLNRLAGLFELADEQFIDIRQESDIAKQKATADIKAGNHQIAINPITLREFLTNWQPMAEIKDFMISVGFSFEVSPDAEWDPEYEEKDYFGIMSEHCRQNGLATIAMLEEALSFNPKRYLQSLFQVNGADWYVTEGFSLYLLLIRAKSEFFTIDDLVSKGWGKSTAEKVLEVAKHDAKLS